MTNCESLHGPMMGCDGACEPAFQVNACEVCGASVFSGCDDLVPNPEPGHELDYLCPTCLEAVQS